MMRIWRKCVLVTLIASSALGMSVVEAMAESGVGGRVGPTFRGTWGTVTWTLSGSSVRCAMTLEGSFHSAVVAKIARALIGYVSRVSLGSPCSQGAATVLSETLPWTLTYGSFTGVLPNITSLGINVINASFRVRETTFGIDCLMRSSAEAPVTLTANRSTATWAFTGATLGGTIPLCFGSAGVSGTSSTLTRLEAAEQIVVSLI
jgi:hypothetical protein